MNKDAFVEALTAAAYDGGRVAGDILRGAEHPVGRGVSAERKARAAWLAGLDEESRARVRQLVDEGVHAGVFGVLAVLDGVRAIEDGAVAGKLVLSHVARDGTETPLNPESGEMLHDLFNWYSRDGGASAPSGG